jgi:hypothetical protein
MERLQIGAARISAITIDVIHLDPVVMLEEQSTVPTVTVLCFEQLGASRTDVWMPSLSATPVHPIPIIRAAVACDLDMPSNRHLTMSVKADGVRARGRGSTGATGAEPMPIPLDGPSDGFGWVPLMCPVAEFDPSQLVKSRVYDLTHPNAIVVRPAADGGIELVDQRALRQGLRASHNLPDRCQMLLDVGLGGFDEGLVSQAMAARALTRLVLPYPILADVEAETINPGLVAL